MVSEPATGHKLMKFLLLPENLHIISRFTLEEISHIVDLPCNVQFFNLLSVIDHYYTEKRTLQSFSFSDYPYSYIQQLYYMRQVDDLDKDSMFN